MTRITQLEAFHALKNLSGKRKIVYDEIKRFTKDPRYRGLTNREIADRLGWEINRVTGRVTELFDRGIILTNETRLHAATNRNHTVWKTP
jgi:hypothetical protein